MNNKKIVSFFMASILSLSLLQYTNVSKVNAEGIIPEKTVKRVQGLNRLQTSIAIAKELNTSKLENVVLAYAYDFPDALSGSTLAKKLNAPLLLIEKQQESKEVLDYIAANLVEKGNVYLLGGRGVVGTDVEQALSQKGYTIIRLAGQNRIETCNEIINSMNVSAETPVFIASANGFADALSASGIAASKDYPILLTGKEALNPLMKAQLIKIAPKNVYIIGGTGVISNEAEKEIQQAVPKAVIERIAGQNRYETSKKVADRFNPNMTEVVLASGKDFPDALSGSLLAAKLNTSILLLDEQDLDAEQSEFDQNGITNFYVLGGNGALSGNVEVAISFNREKEIENVKAVLNKGITAFGQKDLEGYMSTIDETIPEFQDSKELYKELFASLQENDMDMTSKIDSVDIVSINYKEAVVKTKETAAITDNYMHTTDYTTGSATYYLRKVSGQWKIYKSTSILDEMKI